LYAFTFTVAPIVLYACENWPVTLKEQHRSRVSEIRVLRRIFGPKREEVTESRRKLQKGSLKGRDNLGDLGIDGRIVLK
jgi:hypothetical protein